MKRKNEARPSQRERLLALLKSRGSQGVYVYEINAPRPGGLGIAQYNTRIKELRELKHNIINTEPGHFKLIENNTTEVLVKTDSADIAEKKLKNFNQELIELKHQIDSEANKDKRKELESKFKVLRMRARALEIGLEKRDFQGEVVKTLTQGALI